MRYGIRWSVLIAIVLAGTFFIFMPQDDSLKKLQQADVIRVGYAIEAPYAFLGADGSVTGESPEVAKVIIAALGISEIEWIQTDFDLLIAGLLDGRYDVIAAGMFITPERAEMIRFSNPTFHVQPGLLVKADNPLQIYSYQDIADNPNITIAVISSAVEENILLQYGVDEGQFVIVPDALTGRIAVESGLADALALSCVTVRWIASTSESAEAVEFGYESEVGWGYGGFAFRPADIQLVDAWNDAMAAFISSPEHINLIAQFGFTFDELPGAVTLETVLQR